MSLRVYNTLSRTKEPFETIEPGVVRLYVCGPTVYSNAHIGHAMSSLVFDIIRRYLEYKGYKVRHVMNYTDVDDKIIDRANYEGIDPFELAERYIEEYDQHLKDLNILPATIYPRATTEMPFILEMVEGLIARGNAYPAEGDVYFAVPSDEDYGKLSGRKIDDMKAGARIAVDSRKETPMDFAVWKAAKEGEPAWESPWGPGRPGWHIECSAMSLHHLGEQIDIHGGGNDLIFPHHENEIAQSESYTGKSFARYWMHNGMLQLGGEKMSKSLGNLITIEEFLRDHEANTMRMLILNGNYRHPLTFTDEVLVQADKALERIRSSLRPAFPGATGMGSEAKAQLAEQIETTQTGFVDSMDDDFNSAGALGYIFDLVRVINASRDAGATDDDLALSQKTIRDLTAVFGLEIDKETERSADANPFIELLVELRNDLRTNKLWDLSDKVRDKLVAAGVIIEDSKEGSTWRWE
ncbi:MAG: cysteine--tRNA ligase [Anaerolineales bacterium]|nr:cysteine--tRNA ligase [Anaerolineales bacterium]